MLSGAELISFFRHALPSLTVHRRNTALRKGLNIVKGTVVHPAVHADYPLYPYMQVDDMLQL
jgi:alanine dehydrogenase